MCLAPAGKGLGVVGLDFASWLRYCYCCVSGFFADIFRISTHLVHILGREQSIRISNVRVKEQTKEWNRFLSDRHSPPCKVVNMYVNG